MDDILENFNESILNSISNKQCKESKRIITHLIILFDRPLSNSEIDQIFFKLFDEKNGILRILKKTGLKKEFKETILQILNLFVVLVKNFQSRVDHHINSIIETCFQLITSDTYSVIKENVLNLFCNIIECTAWTKLVNIKNIFCQTCNYCNRNNKLSPKVKGSIFCFLGLITKMYKDEIWPLADNFKTYLTTTLTTCIKKRDSYNLSLLKGLLEGLDHFLVNFAPDPKMFSTYYTTLYGHIKIMSDPTDQYRKTAFRAALNLISTHGHLFATYLIKDYQWWHQTLTNWLDLSYDNRKAGMLALNAFYKITSDHLRISYKEENKDMFLFFFDFFKTSIISNNLQSLELRLAIRGFGLFAGPCRVYLSPEDVSYMFFVILQRMNIIYLSDNEPLNDDLEYLPNYIATLSEIMMELDEVTQDNLCSLQEATILMIKTFPQLHKSYQHFVFESLIQTMILLHSSKNNILKDFISKVIYQSILWTCSHNILIDAEIQKEVVSNNSDIVTYKNYLPFWTNLIYRSKNKKINDEVLILPILLDELLQSLMVIITKLDLTIKTKIRNDVTYCDPESGFEASNPKDFVIFVNVVDFYCEILKYFEPSLFQQSIISLTQKIIKLSHKHFLVSGFYKLITTNLIILDKLNYFHMDDVKTEDEKFSFVVLLNNYLQEVIIKAKQYKGDLQISLFEVILVAPVVSIQNLMPLLNSMMESVFIIGRIYYKLAFRGLDALNQWYTKLPYNEIAPLLKFILPQLDIILRSKSFRGDADIKLNIFKKSNKRDVSKKKIDVICDPELTILKQKIAIFIGQLNIDLCNALINTQKDTESIHLKCNYLQYTVPFQDISPKIDLDQIIPRIAELAVKSSDRKTRVTACEVFHAIVLIMLGKNKQIQTKSENFLQVFEKVLFPLLQLGCDTDQVVQQLFNPLVLQIIHYYTSSFQFCSEETGVIINTLIECITHPSDVKIRDFSTKCLNEFIEWSIKQQIGSNNTNSLSNVEVVLKKICDLCLHPDLEKRLGAALAINSIHNLLKKEYKLIDKFWIELLYSFIINLSMSDINCNETVNVSEQVQKSLDYIVTDIMRNKDVLNKTNKKRRKPVVIDEANLNDIINWIFQQCGRTHIDCSHKCMEIFCKIAPCADKYTSPKLYISNFIENTHINDFIKIIEFNLNFTHSCIEVDNVTSLLKWFNQLLLSLDCYNWLLDEYLITPQILFSGDNKVQDSIFNFLQNISHFNEMVQNEKLAILKLKEYHEFDRLKCWLLIRIFNFIINTVKYYKQCKIWNILWCEQLWKIISCCLCNPESLGFDLKNKEIADNLPKILKDMLLNLKQYLDPLEFQKFSNTIEIDVKFHLDKSASIVDVMKGNHISVNDSILIKNLIVLNESKFLINLLPQSSKIFQCTFNSVVQKFENSMYGVKMNSSVHEYVECLITLAFSLDDQKMTVIDFFKSDIIIKDPLMCNDITQAEYFFTMYSDVILKNLMRYPVKSFELLLNFYISDHNRNVFTILIELLKQLHKNRHIKKKNCEEIISLTLSKWSLITANISHDFKNVNDVINLLQHTIMIMEGPVNKLCNHNSKIDEWILNQLLIKNYSPLTDLLNYKIRLLDFLPCISGCSDTNSHFQKCIEEFIKIHFEKESTSLETRSPEQVNLILLFRKLLKSLKITGSLAVFHVLIKLILKFSSHLNEKEIQNAFKFCMNRLKSDVQFKMIEMMYIMTVDEVYTQYERMHILMKYLLILLDFCNFYTIEKFFTAKISELICILNMKFSDNGAEDILVRKIIAFSLIECLFFKFDSNYFESKSCSITLAAFTGNIETGKELIKEIAKCALTARKNTIDSTNEINDLFVTYQCCAYKTLVAVISNTQVDIDKYRVLFYHEENGKDILWEKIVNCSKNYTFSQDFDEYPSKKRQIISIRNRIRKEIKDTSTFKGTHNFNYISSQNLFSSTLNEDVTKFDFTDAILKNQLESSTDEVHIQTNTGMVIELESNDLNDHECMACLCGLVQHVAYLMENNKESHRDTPFWVLGIKKTLLNNNIHKNVKLFLLKLIENNQDIFKPYANVFFIPILKAISNEICGDNMNYFNIDLINMILLWHTEIEITSEDKMELMNFLHFIVDHAGHEQKKLFKLHIELLKTVVEVWRNEITVSNKMLEYFSKKNEELDIIVAINICAIFVVNKLKPWNDLTKVAFFNSIYSYFKSENREIYLPCSELLGMTFTMIVPHPESFTLTEDKDFVRKIKRHLDEMFGSRNYNKFFYCLHGIHKYYPLIMDDVFTKAILLEFETVTGDKFKIILMELLISGLKRHYPGSVKEIKLSFFEECLKEIDSEVQLLALLCVKEILNVLDPKLFLDIFSIIADFVTHKNSQCRSLMYDIMIWTFEKYESASENNFTEIYTISRNILLFGLQDIDEEIQSKLFNFWSDKIKTSPDTITRFLEILKKLHSSSLDNYLGYCMYFIFEMTNNSPNLKKNIFEHPLNFCEFSEHKVLINWRAQNVSLVPLFAETLSSQTNQTNSCKFNAVEAQVMVKATQASQSTSTFIKPSTYNPTVRESIQSSLLFTTRDNPENLFFEQDKQTDSDDSSKKSGPFVYRYRFLKNSTKLSKYFAMKENYEAGKREELKQDYFKKKERNVTLYRSYRIGDFPDIEISNYSFIKPLQILLKQDEILAQLLFTSLVNGFINDSDTNTNEFILTIGNCIIEILDSTNIFSPNIVEPFLHLALQHINIIDIPIETVVLASRESGLLPLGCLLLEEKIIREVDDEPLCKKTKSEMNLLNQNDAWIKLVELYTSISEWDVVTTIFGEKMGYNEVLKGLEYQSTNQWRKAQDIYEVIIEKDIKSESQGNIPRCLMDFYYEMCFNCFAHLSDWNGLLKSLNVLVTDYDSVWSQAWTRDKLLPWLIKTELQVSLPQTYKSGEKNDNIPNSDIKILDYLNKWMSDKEKSDLLKCKFSEELTMFSITCKQIEQAKYYNNKNKSMFLNDWSQLSIYLTKPRFDKLVNLQRMADIEIYLSLLETLNTNNYKEKLDRIVASWNNDMDFFSGKLMLTKNKVEYRKQFLMKISDKLKQINCQDEEVFKFLSKSMVDMDLKIFDMAFHQQNFHVGRAYLRGHHKNISSLEAPEMLKMNLTISKFMFLRSYVEHDDNKYEHYLKSLEHLDGKVFNNENFVSYPFIQIESYQHKFVILESLLGMVLKYPHFNKTICKRIPSCRNEEIVTESLNKQCLDSLHKWIDISENQFNENSEQKNIKSLRSAYMHLVNYCRKFETENKDFINELTIFILRAMKLGSTSAKHIFPCLLQRTEIYTSLKSTFIDESDQVPEWMFIQWIPQLLSVMDGPALKSVEHIVLKIAAAYPQAMIYAFHLSKEKYSLDNNEELKETVIKLESILFKYTEYGSLLKALSAVVVPEIKLKYYLTKLRNSLHLSEKEIKTAYDSLLNTFQPESDLYHGAIFGAVQKLCKNKLSSLFKENKPLESIKLELAKIEIPSQRKSLILKDYSPWLANYQSFFIQNELEIPGQYTGDRKPLPQYHIRINNFNRNIEIMPSLRQPIKIIIMGNDGKEYPYLNKFGEDIRQDQRIQQLFCLMNNILREDFTCNYRNLEISTYQVIPLTTTLGIIQWVDAHKSLKDILYGSKSEESHRLCLETMNSYCKWLHRKTNSTTDFLIYEKLCDLSSNEIIPKYREHVNMIPWDILRKAFWKLSSSSINFFSLRQKFSTSYAVMCIAHWILGIGDRHLSNSLVSLQDGKILGIDFGYAFGTSTQCLPVPELIPFRLTPHILNLMQPFDEKGILSQTMSHCLRAFRKNHDLLVATMEVFIQEPSLDWLEITKIKTENFTSENWYPKKKVLQSMRKLQGVNPMVIIIEDLTENRITQNISKYINFIQGVDQHTNRNRFDNENLKVEEQIECLLSLATDYNILGRTYYGWQPWI